MKKYVLHPGFITSVNDGDRHFIDALTLARLHCVDINDCYVVRHPTREHGFASSGKHLYPRRFPEDYPRFCNKGDNCSSVEPPEDVV